jgi:hypothetical protein
LVVALILSRTRMRPLGLGLRVVPVQPSLRITTSESPMQGGGGS